MSQPLVIAIDGPSGSGKSSTARGVAARLGLDYLDTGAMYRAITWAMLRDGVDIADAHAVASHAVAIDVQSGVDPADPTIHVGGDDVAVVIRGDEVTGAVSPVAAVPAVRELLVDAQRRIIAKSAGIVVEGRDIGTVVSPGANTKIYLVADHAARADRRAAERGSTDTGAVAHALSRRDEIDSSRTISPLAQAEDAIVVDSTNLTLDEVIETIVRIVEKR